MFVKIYQELIFNYWSIAAKQNLAKFCTDRSSHHKVNNNILFVLPKLPKIAKVN